MAPEPAAQGGPSPVMVGGGVLALAGVGGYLMMGGKTNEPAKKAKAPTPTPTPTQPAAVESADVATSGSPDWGEPLGNTTEGDVLLNLEKVAGRLSKVQSVLATIVAVDERICRIENRLVGDLPVLATIVDSAAVAALAKRLSAAEATLQKAAAASADAELEDPQILATLEALAVKLAKLEQRALGK